MEAPILNSHNKAEYEPAHTGEHSILMSSAFGKSLRKWD